MSKIKKKMENSNLVYANLASFVVYERNGAVGMLLFFKIRELFTGYRVQHVLSQTDTPSKQVSVNK